MARLDRLAPVREVVQIGAALGRDFSYELLHAVAGLPDTRLQGSLHDLVQAELVFCRGTAPNSVYTFNHALVQDAALRHHAAHPAPTITLAALTIIFISMLTRAALSAPQELGDGLPDTVAGTEVVIPASGIVLTGYEVRPSPNRRNMPGVLLLHSSGADAQSSLAAASSLADRRYV
jgi:hypothetical protein